MSSFDGFSEAKAKARQGAGDDAGSAEETVSCRWPIGFVFGRGGWLVAARCWGSLPRSNLFTDVWLNRPGYVRPGEGSHAPSWFTAFVSLPRSEWACG
jgi:hypothetical protein